MSVRPEDLTPEPEPAAPTPSAPPAPTAASKPKKKPDLDLGGGGGGGDSGGSSGGGGGSSSGGGGGFNLGLSIDMNFQQQLVSLYESLWGLPPSTGWVNTANKSGMNLFQIEWAERQKPSFRSSIRFAEEALSAQQRLQSLFGL